MQNPLLKVHLRDVRAALTAVETSATFAIDAGKAYELSGWMKNDGDGLFGLRVTWISGDRKLSEHPVVLKDTQEWKEKTITITPPSWALLPHTTRRSAGCVGIFV